MQKIQSRNFPLTLLLAIGCQSKNYQNGYYINKKNEIAEIHNDSLFIYNSAKYDYKLSTKKSKLIISDFSFACNLPEQRNIECTVLKISALRFEFNSMDSCAIRSKFSGIYQLVDISQRNWDSLRIEFIEPSTADKLVIRNEFLQYSSINKQALDNEVKLIQTGLCDKALQQESTLPKFMFSIYAGGILKKKMTVSTSPFILPNFISITYPNLNHAFA